MSSEHVRVFAGPALSEEQVKSVIVEVNEVERGWKQGILYVFAAVSVTAARGVSTAGVDAIFISVAKRT
jgi:hypothetical protein